MADVAGAVSPVLGGLIRELDRAAPTDLVEVCRTWVIDNLGVQDCALLLADYSETTLEPVPGADGTPAGSRVDVDDSAAGAAYRHQHPIHVAAPTPGAAPAGCMLTYLPVRMRTERLGVLAIAQRTTNEPDLLNILNDVAQVLAYVLTGARRYTDRFETLRRRRDLGLAAEIQWELLPVLAYELPRFSIAGALEPAYDIGGDTFDYAVSAQQLSVSITDAVGHGLRAAMLSSLTVSALRNARRCGFPILDQARTANRHLSEQFAHAEFVTGLLLQLEVPTGHGVLINAGHPPPLLLRQEAVSILSLPPDAPMGLSPDTHYRQQAIRLRPGDRLLLLTDGIEEAHDFAGPQFGLARVADLLRSHTDLPPVEFVRLLTKAVTDYRNGPLADDATAVCLDWYPITSAMVDHHDLVSRQGVSTPHLTGPAGRPASERGRARSRSAGRPVPGSSPTMKLSSQCSRRHRHGLPNIAGRSRPSPTPRIGRRHLISGKDLLPPTAGGSPTRDGSPTATRTSSAGQRSARTRARPTATTTPPVTACVCPWRWAGTRQASILGSTGAQQR